jgi:hypothetical protein
MSRTFKAIDDDWELFPEGTTAVVLTSMMFVWRHEREWQGQKSAADMVCLEWTAPEAGAEGGDLSTWEVLTVAFGQKSNLYKRLRALAGGKDIPDGIDLQQPLPYRPDLKEYDTSVPECLEPGLFDGLRYGNGYDNELYLL